MPILSVHVFMISSDDHAAFTPMQWVHRRGVLSLAQPRIMAIVNLTPDSFFDGGVLFDGGDGDTAHEELALRRCAQLVADGADLIDIGGESTRPGAEPIGPERELARVGPLIVGARWLFDESADARQIATPISVDTRHAEVAQQAIELGADIINDVSGLADPAMAQVAARTGAGLVIGHLRGEPRTMHRTLHFADLLSEVTQELTRSVERALEAGVERERIVVDPGIGFGKSAEQSAALIAASMWLREATSCPVLIGASRKSFLHAFTGAEVEGRLAGSLAAGLIAVQHGASILRVHDVRETADALRVAAAIESSHERQLRIARHGRDVRTRQEDGA